MKRKSFTSASKQPSKSRKKSRVSSPDVVFIPKEPTPDAGDIEYINDCLHPNTLRFLIGKETIVLYLSYNHEDLKRHNDREWFWTNEASRKYERLLADTDL